MKLINANDIQFQEIIVDGKAHHIVTKAVLDKLPEVDPLKALDVCYCRECVYHKGDISGVPNILCYQMHDDDFCSYGTPDIPSSKKQEDVISYARELGAFIEKATSSSILKQNLKDALGLSDFELEKLYRGRLFLTNSDLTIVTEVLNVSMMDLVKIDRQYTTAVHEVMLLIDAYIDAMEALHEDEVRNLLRTAKFETRKED